MSYTVKVEEARPATEQKPSAGPVYRSIYAKDGLLELPEGLQSPWDFFRCIHARICICYIISIYVYNINFITSM